MEIFKEENIKKYISGVQSKGLYIIHIISGSQANKIKNELFEKLPNTIGIFYSQHMIDPNKILLYKKENSSAMIKALRYDLGEPEGFINLYNATRILSLLKDIEKYTDFTDSYFKTKKQQVIRFIQEKETKTKEKAESMLYFSNDFIEKLLLSM